MPISDALRDAVRAYLADDPDEGARATLATWLETENEAAIRGAFDAPIAFGTAGLRAEVGPGPSQMNARNVRRATRALVEVVRERVVDAAARGIVVGHDARPDSARFARDVARVVRDAGFAVRTFDDAVPTPLVAFAAAELGTAAAVVITASHNPPADNGMKVYGPGGALIVSPWDTEIASRMHDARPTPEWPADEAPFAVVPASVRDTYVARCLAIGARGERVAEIRVAYTALHGVGESLVRRCVTQLPFVRFESVAEQASPDGTFPTVDKPNPEEPSALVRLRALAERTASTLALANDPDADRLAVLVRHEGALTALHGDELGVLLGHHLARSVAPAGAFVVRTVVSSPWLEDVARDLGVRCETTLTGHKWIHARRTDLEQRGERFVFGYEEALGYAFDHGVRDKDGIAAAVLVMRIAGELARDGETLVDRLEAIAVRHGMHRSHSFSIATPDDDARRALGVRVNELVGSRGAPVLGREVRAVLDGARAARVAPDGSETPLGVPASSLVGFELADGLRVLIRPSGTEPKTKVYLDLGGLLAPGETYLEARARCDAVLATVEAELRVAFA